MEEITIDKNIELPSRRQRGGKWKSLLTKMEVYDSFFIKNLKRGEASKFYGTASRLGMKVSVRECDGGVRVWRTK